MWEKVLYDVFSNVDCEVGPNETISCKLCILMSVSTREYFQHVALLSLLVRLSYTDGTVFRIIWGSVYYAFKTSQSREASHRHRKHRRMTQSVRVFLPAALTHTHTMCVCLCADMKNCVYMSVQYVCLLVCVVLQPAAFSQPTYSLMEPKCLGLLLLHVNLQ